MLGAHPRARFDGGQEVEARTILKTRTVLVVVAALMLAAPAAASASTASVQGYGTPAATEQVGVAGATGQGSTHNSNPSTQAPSNATTAAPAKSVSGLPFTGFDVLLMVLAGVLLLGVGFVLRWMARSVRSPQGSQ